MRAPLLPSHQRLCIVLTALVGVACQTPAASIDGGLGDVAVDGGRDAGAVDGGDGDAGHVDPCAPLVTAADGGCVFGPTAEPGACPAYIGLSCAISFIPTTIGSGTTETIAIFNHGGAPLHISAITLDAPSQFALLSSLPGALLPDEFATVSVRFTPSDAGIVRGTVRVTSDAVFPPHVAVPLEGSTPQAACSGAADCLLSEQCDATSNQCESCPGPTPPPCDNGHLVAYSSGGCPLPVCQCGADAVYRSGVGCVAAESCGANGLCANQASCESLCCSAPICLCTIPDAGVCAP